MPGGVLTRTLLAGALLLGLVAPVAAQPAGAQGAPPPVGNLDGVELRDGRAFVRGWAYEPERPDQAVDVHVYADATFIGRTPADETRPDLAASLGIGADHGFAIALPLPSGGAARICAYAIDVPSLAGVLLGCQAIERASPIGVFDGVLERNGQVLVSGWVHDADTPTTPSLVHVYVDGVFAGQLTADQSRPDVARALGIGDRKGFAGPILAPRTGAQVCAYAINAPVWAGVLLGCRPLSNTAPIGAFDTVQARNGGLFVSGWAHDADAPATPLLVHVYVDGVFAGELTADGARPDVARVLGVDARKGFAGTLPVSRPGTVCAYAINVPFWAGVLLGCKPGPPRDGPLGALDVAEQRGGGFFVSGWAYDPAAPDTPLTVRVVADGAVRGEVVADGIRPDLTAVLGISPNHGFETTVSVPDSTRTVCVEASLADGGTFTVGCSRRAEGTGVLVTPTGVVVPILGQLSNGWNVQTPCGAETIVTAGSPVRSATVVLDPGHGGTESGAVGANGLAERDVNLAVSLRAEQLLEASGIDVMLTRTLDHDMAISTRAAIANGLQPDLFVSVHHNGGAIVARSTPGTEVYVQTNDPESRRAGGLLYEELFAAASRFPTAWVGTVRAGVSARFNSAGSDFYGVHRRTPNIPSVITEFLYLSNPPEAALLARLDVVEAEAQAIARGIERYLRTNDPGSGSLPDFVSDFSSGGQACFDPPLQ